MWCWLGLDKDSSTFGPADASIFRDVTLLTLGVGGFCSFLFHLILTIDKKASDEAQRDSGNESEEEIINEEDEISFTLPEIVPKQDQQMTVFNWLCEPQLYQVAFLYMSSRLFVNISQAYMPLYLNICLELPATYVAIIPMIMYVSGIFVAVITKTATKHLGIKITTGIYSVVGIIGCIWMHWGKLIRKSNKVKTCKYKIGTIPKKQKHYNKSSSISGSKDNLSFKNIEIYFVALFIGSGGAGMLITSLSITAQLIGKNTESSAFVYGAISFVDKLSSGTIYIFNTR